MLPWNEISEKKSTDHRKLVKKIIRDNLLSRISFNGNEDRLRPWKIWEELYLTHNGIFKDASQVHGHQMVGSPDLSFVSIDPDYLIFAEVKI